MSGALQSKHCEGSFSGCELDDGRAGDNNSNKNNNNDTNNNNNNMNDNRAVHRNFGARHN